MASDRLVVSVDTPGYGGSDPPPAPTNLEAYAAALATVLESLELDKVDLFGAHTGSRLAVEVAHLCPEKINRLILFGAAIYTADEREKQKESFARPKPVQADGSHMASRWTGWAAWRHRRNGRSLRHRFGSGFRAPLVGPSCGVRTRHGSAAGKP